MIFYGLLILAALCLGGFLFRVIVTLFGMHADGTASVHLAAGVLCFLEAMRRKP